MSLTLGLKCITPLWSSPSQNTVEAVSSNVFHLVKRICANKPYFAYFWQGVDKKEVLFLIPEIRLAIGFF